MASKLKPSVSPAITPVIPARFRPQKSTTPTLAVDPSASTAINDIFSDSIKLPDNPYKKVYLTSKSVHAKHPHNIMQRFDENNNEVDDDGSYGKMDTYNGDEGMERMNDQHQSLLEGEDTNAVRAAGDEMVHGSDEENFAINNEDYIYNEDDEGDQQVDEFFYEDYNENEDDRAQDSYDKCSSLLDGKLLFFYLKIKEASEDLCSEYMVLLSSPKSH